MTTAQPQVDVNEAFAAERATQLQRLADQRADIDRRITEGTLTPLGGGRYRVTDPTSFDDGEIWRLTENGLRPQHELDTTTGQAALYTRVPAWHGLGSVIPEGTTDIEEVLRLGGINFEVATRPVLYHPDPADAALSPRILPGQYVTVREDTGTGLGVVGHRYTVFQNRETFWFLQDLTDRYDVTWESAGALREGRRVFVCLRLPETITIDAGGINDEITPFLAAINSHDGSSLFQVALTPWRIVCGNTERFALEQAHSRWGVRHTRHARDRLNEARRTLGLSMDYYRVFAAEEEALARTEVALTDWRRVLDELWPPPGEDAPTRTEANHVQRRTTLDRLWETNTDRLGRTAYAAERAITEYTDWYTSVRPTRVSRGDNLAVRATAVMEGTHDRVKTRAHRRLLTLTHR
ncbi:MAG: DUF932 domain-containing protein [Actinobacteria bacterium]|nr:DUF932 domain-containing protein [Actinomycetota bacterium]MBI3687404.1 DUF932 domain-containing protein [Actinomycetota bacterium]